MDRQQERLFEAGTANDGSRTTKGESQKEAQRQTCSLVIPKQRFTIGFCEQCIKEDCNTDSKIQGYKLDILGFSETGAGKMRLDSGQIVIYSGLARRSENTNRMDTHQQ